MQYLAQKIAQESSPPSIREIKHKSGGHAIEPILANISLMWGVCTIPCVIIIRHTKHLSVLGKRGPQHNFGCHHKIL